MLHLVVAAVVVSCAALGFWQLRRLEGRQAQNALLATRRAEAPEDLGRLLERIGADLSNLAHRRAEAEGVYDPSREVLWQRGSTYRGQPGYQLLTPLILEDGSALLVDRGWAPFSYRQPPVAEARPPGGRVAVAGALRLPQTPPGGFWANLAPRNPPGELAITAYADPARLQEQMPYRLLPVVLELSEQRPSQADLLPAILPSEALTDGPHLGYAVQWFAFALIGFVGYGLLLRRVALEDSKKAS